jgi:hypothetical protein
VHPAEEGPGEAADGTTHAELYLMCDDLRATIDALAAKGVRCTDVHEEWWGIRNPPRPPQRRRDRPLPADAPHHPRPAARIVSVAAHLTCIVR